MDHSLYRPEDFACDESYLRYYFRINDKDIGYWEHWIRTHPEKLDVVMSADQLIGFLSLQLPEDEFQHEYERFTKAMAKSALLESTHSAKGIEILPSLRRQSRRRRRTGGWLVLASVLLVAGSAWLFEYRQHAGPAAAVLSGNTLTRSNTTNTPMSFTLEEATQVKLDPGARLSWPTHFPPGKREVVLDGSAFFQVSKDPHHPFFVYCHDLVVHVLGTTFLVTDGKKDNTIEVSVSSGKVEVYEKTAIASKENAPGKRANGVLLAPNQELIYTGNNRAFEVTLVDKPLPLDSSINSNFQQARIYEVIQSLQHIYGVEIEVEEEALYNCRFSGKLGDMDLYTALNVLCRPLGINWERRQTKILLRGPGCNTP